LASEEPDGGAPEIVQLHGLSVPIDRRVMSDKIVESIRLGRYEMAEAARLPGIVRPGERVVEVGAGIGVLTALIGRFARAELVVAIEANPRLQDYIAELHRMNSVEAVVRQALVTPAPAAKPATLYLHQDLWASSPAWISRKSQIGVVEVPVLSLQEIAEAWAPSLLILDVEPFAAWAEASGPPHALDTADFRPFARVLVELKPKRFPPQEVRRVFDHFTAQGFAAVAAEPGDPLVLFERR